MRRFETRDKYYFLDCHQNLFDDWVVLCAWGNKFTRQGRCRFIKVDNKWQGSQLIDKMSQRRIQRGYRLLPDKEFGG